MGTSERRAREKENLRRAILDAARGLFATEDYKTVSMRKIAEKIEYSPTAIYLHFKDKEEILGALIAEGFERLAAAVHAFDDVPDPVERLRRGARAYFAFAFENPHYYRLMFQLEDKQMAANLLPRCAAAPRAFGFIVECVTEAQHTGAFRDDAPAVVVANAAWAGVHGAVTLTLSGHLQGMLPAEHHPAFYEQVIDVILRGSAAAPAV